MQDRACWRILYAAHSSLCAAACRQNPCIAKGRTIVIGTSQGLYARAHALTENAIVVRTTTEDGQVFGPHRLALDPDTLVAYAVNGEPLATEHGFPLRIVAPGWAGVRSPKWLSAITVQDRPSDAHQQAGDYKLFPPDMRPEAEDLSRGITIEAMPLNCAVTAPAPGAALKAGRVGVEGYAVAFDRDIVRVDLSGDGGRSWSQATIEDYGSSRWGWTFWHGALDLPPGEHEICARAWDAAGQTQPALPDDTWNFKGYLSAAWHRLRVTAA